MKEENILMRILFCNIHCPILCFCKPSAAASLYAAASVSSGASAGPLPPPPPQTIPCRVVSVSDSSDQSFEDANDDSSNDTGLKSCIKKRREKKGPAGDAAAEEETDKKKKVQWVDEAGQELAEILEFESSECGDMDYEEENQSGCVCTIL